MLSQTALYEAHIASGAKTGEFAGYDMPLYYNEGVIAEHEWVRSSCGIFDVSHMGQVIIEGPGVAQFLEKLTPSAFQPKANGRAQYTALLNEQGGIIDDLIITRIAENKFFAVINAGCKFKDMDWINEQLPAGITMSYFENHSLIAVQGQHSEAILREVLGIETAELPYMHCLDPAFAGSDEIFVSRVGYTGEDGFELSVPNDKAADVWNKLNADERVKPIGLAARDSLRLEMGYALYGHDINDKTSPVEGGMSWVISKKTTGYFGYERVQRDLQNADKNFIGIKLTGKGVAREGAEIRNANDEKIGEMTSGGFSPTLKQSIGQGYVNAGSATGGDQLLINVRGRNIEAVVTGLPHIQAKTKSMKKKAA